MRDILAAKGQSAIVTATPASKVREVIATMKALGISQLPVVEQGKLRGIVAEVDLLRTSSRGCKTLDSPIGELVEGDYATVTLDTKIELLQGVPRRREGRDRRPTAKRCVGIVTKIDLIDFLAKQPMKGASTPPPALAPRKNGHAKEAKRTAKGDKSDKATKATKSAKPAKRSKEKARARA